MKEKCPAAECDWKCFPAKNSTKARCIICRLVRLHGRLLFNKTQQKNNGEKKAPIKTNKKSIYPTIYSKTSTQMCCNNRSLYTPKRT